MTFDDRSTTDDVLEGIDLMGREVLVTGASTGLGEETTRALAAHGATVTMAVRDPQRGAAAVERIRATVPDAELTVMVLDLASLADVRRFAGEYLASHDHLDVLVDNAGVMACPQAETVDGFELQIGTNHVGHFLLTQLLLPLLGAGSRVVVLSSAGHRFSDVDLDDPNFERTEYDPWGAYGRAKTANALFAVELDRRLRDRGAHAYSVHPGGIVTELGRHLTEETLARITDVPDDQRIEWKTVPQGAATTAWAATASDLDAHGGAYLEDCMVAATNADLDPQARGGVKPYAVDPARVPRRCGIARSSGSRRRNEADAGRRRGPGAGGWSCASTGVRRAGWGMLAVASQRPGIPVCSRVRTVHGVSAVTRAACPAWVGQAETVADARYLSVENSGSVSNSGITELPNSSTVSTISSCG